MVKFCRHVLLLFFLIWICSPLQGLANIGLMPETSIPLLKNRIRVDKNVNEITLWIQRVPNSRPVIVVLPDGSKWYENRHPKTVHWLHTQNVDIISIENPMRGPWQILGKVLPQSKISLMSNVELQTTRLARKLYHNELIKVTSRLLINKKPAQDPYYLSTATLRIIFQNFLSETDPTAVENLDMAELKDDGKSLDEVPNDGIMTTQLLIKAPPGKYTATYLTSNDVFIRGYNQEVWVYPTPVRIEYINPEKIDQQPQLNFNLDIDELKPETIVMQGNISNQHGHVEDIVLWAAEQKNNFTLTQDYSDGLYSTEFTLYGQTISNREIMLKLPPFSFNYKTPQPPAPDPASLPAEPEVVETESHLGLWIGIGITILILAAGGVVAFILIKRKKAASEANQETQDMSQTPAVEKDNKTTQENTKQTEESPTSPPTADDKNDLIPDINDETPVENPPNLDLDDGATEDKKV